MPNQDLLRAEEVLEALQEKSHRTVRGIEVIEYETSGLEMTGQGLAQPARVAPAASVAVRSGASPDGESARFSRLEREHARLVTQFERARQDWQERERQYQDRILALVTNFSALEQQLCDKSAELQALMGESERPGSHLPGEDEVTSGVTVGFVGPHHARESTVESLKARIRERGRALSVLREETDALRAETRRLTRALAERGQQIARLMDQLTQVEVNQGFGVDFRGGLRRLFQRDPTLATASDGDAEWTPLVVDETTVVLASVADSEQGCEVSVPDSATGPHDRAATNQREPARDSRNAPGAAVRLRRYLLPLDQRSGRVFELSGSRAYVGRDVEADLCIRNATISRLHGVLYCIGGATIVEDARSTNGIYVNRERVVHAVLKDGDVVAFGNVEFNFRVAVSDA